MSLNLESLREQLKGKKFSPLFATVSGAHLYGFESADSDIDLRGTFVLPLEQIVGLTTGPETVNQDYWHDGIEMDLVCHEILKFCRLLSKRSGEVLEQLYSPLVVWPSPELDELRELARPLIVPHFYHHYRGFLGNQLKFVDREGSTVKEMLYAYRVALTGIHLLRTGQLEANLSHLLPDYPQPGVADLIDMKRAQQEKTPLDETLKQTHRQRLSELEARLETAFVESKLPKEADLRELNDFVVRVRLGRSC